LIINETFSYNDGKIDYNITYSSYLTTLFTTSSRP